MKATKEMHKNRNKKNRATDTATEPETNGVPVTNTTGIEIETNVPVPAARSNAKYPWASLEVGHSFFAPINHKGGSTQAYQASKRYGVHFIARKAEKDGVEGVRFHRIEEPMRSRKAKAA